MSIWAKILMGGAILVLLAAGLAFWMDLYGVRRGCFASGLDQAAYESAHDLYGRAGSAIAQAGAARDGRLAMPTAIHIAAPRMGR